jgi:DNA-binding response OmpR family regulator
MSYKIVTVRFFTIYIHILNSDKQSKNNWFTRVKQIPKMRPVEMIKGKLMQLKSDSIKIPQPGYWSNPPVNQTITPGRLQILPGSIHVIVHDIDIFLRPLEFRLLHFIMAHRGEVHTRERMLEEICGNWIVIGWRAIDLHIRWLRVMLQPCGLNRWVRSVYCRGYLFSPKLTTNTSTN